MLTHSQIERIRGFAAEIADREGCRLYDLEFRDRTLRVFIDRTSGGVSVDDCVNVSKGLNLRLDVEDAIPGGRYELEVSSPGLERKLTESWHFAGAVGQPVQLRYKNSAGESVSYEGRLVTFENGELKLENKKGPFLVELASVEKARVILGDTFDKKSLPGKKKR